MLGSTPVGVDAGLEKKTIVALEPRSRVATLLRVCATSAEESRLFFGVGDPEGAEARQYPRRLAPFCWDPKA